MKGREEDKRNFMVGVEFELDLERMEGKEWHSRKTEQHEFR